MSERLVGAELPAGIKPQQHLKSCLPPPPTMAPSHASTVPAAPGAQGHSCPRFNPVIEAGTEPGAGQGAGGGCSPPGGIGHRQGRQGRQAGRQGRQAGHWRSQPQVLQGCSLLSQRHPVGAGGKATVRHTGAVGAGMGGGGVGAAGGDLASVSSPVSPPGPCKWVILRLAAWLIARCHLAGRGVRGAQPCSAPTVGQPPRSGGPRGPHPSP